MAELCSLPAVQRTLLTTGRRMAAPGGLQISLVEVARSIDRDLAATLP
jgi:hypothetical protein